MFQAKDSAILGQQLKVQEVTVRASDTQLYVVNAGDVCVMINEEIAAAVLCLHVDDSVPSVAVIANADLIPSDSTALTAGGDRKALRINGVASLAANDALVIKYIVQE